MKELNKYLTNSFANFRSSVQKIEQLSYHAVPKLVDGTPNRILIHGGYNGISNKTLMNCWKWQKYVVVME